MVSKRGTWHCCNLVLAEGAVADLLAAAPDSPGCSCYIWGVINKRKARDFIYRRAKTARQSRNGTHNIRFTEEEVVAVSLQLRVGATKKPRTKLTSAELRLSVRMLWAVEVSVARPLVEVTCVDKVAI